MLLEPVLRSTVRSFSVQSTLEELARGLTEQEKTRGLTTWVPSSELKVSPGGSDGEYVITFPQALPETRDLIVNQLACTVASWQAAVRGDNPQTASIVVTDGYSHHGPYTCPFLYPPSPVPGSSGQ